MRTPVLLALLAACGDNVAALTPREFFESRQIAECQRLTRCGLFESQTACEAYIWPAGDVDVEAAVNAGRLRYRPQQASQCLEEVANASCDQTARDARIMAACDATFTGLVGADAACTFDDECISGRCNRPSCDQQCCAGTCEPPQPRSPVDAPCERDADCVDDTFCGDDRACHPARAANEACRKDSNCMFGLACVGALIDPGTCRPLPLLGEACPYGRCAELGAHCDATGICAPDGPGAPCTVDEDCSFYGACDLAAGRCGPIPTLGLACRTRCAGVSWCDHQAGRCVEPAANGTPCEAGDQCMSLYCEIGPFAELCADEPACF